MDACRQRSTPRRIALRETIERGLRPDFSGAAPAGRDRIPDPPAVKIFPMPPGELPPDPASPGSREDRPAIVTGPRTRVQPVHTDVERGAIDFERVDCGHAFE